MPKTTYVGVSAKARKIKGAYIGVNGVARKVIKAYMGINGVAQQIYAAHAFTSYSGEYSALRVTIDGIDYDLYTLTTSGTLVINDKVRCWMCGGGAGGASGGYAADPDLGYIGAGGGGGGGYVMEGILQAGSHTVTIGAGGSADSDGGRTSVGNLSADGGKTARRARGGDGGSGGGAGALIHQGSLAYYWGGIGAGASTTPFGLESLKTHCAGGGGASCSTGGSRLLGADGGSNGASGHYQDDETEYADTGLGGEYGGGDGGYFEYNGTQTKPKDAGYYGGGGGGGAYYSEWTSDNATAQAGGKGYQGVVYLLIEAHSTSIPDEPDPYVFTITKQPIDFVGKLGDTASFTVEVTGEGLTYVWQYLQAGTSTWRTWPDRTEPTFTIVLNSDLRMTHKYRCVITDANGDTLITNEVCVIDSNV